MGLTKIYKGFYKHFSVIYLDKFGTTRPQPSNISANLSATLSTSMELNMVYKEAGIEVDRTWWPTWRWTWWVVADIDIDMEIQFGERVGHGGWAQTFSTRSLPGLHFLSFVSLFSDAGYLR